MLLSGRPRALQVGLAWAEACGTGKGIYHAGTTTSAALGEHSAAHAFYTPMRAACLRGTSWLGCCLASAAGPLPPARVTY